jgi:hypothetical protein
LKPPPSVSGKFEEKLLLMTPMGDVPDETGYEVPVCSWHGVPFLKQRFREQKHCSKGNNYTIKALLVNHLSHLPWSDPEPQPYR